MSLAVVRTRSWVVLGAVTGGALALLLWAAGKPAICAAVSSPTESCTQASRLLPAVVGVIVVVGLAAATAAIALRSPGRRDGVHRSEGVIALGSIVIGAVGIVFAVVTLFSAGFALGL